MNNMIGCFYGMPIVTSFHLTETIQFRFPKSKKKRIRKKWSKNESNYRLAPSSNLYITNNTIYMHPETRKKIHKLMENNLPINFNYKQ